MTVTRARCIRACGVALCFATSAWGFVAGGGPATSDCYAEWQVTTSAVTANKGTSGVDCQDGDPACDVDGQRDGACTVGLSICVFQRDVPRCTPQQATAIKLSKPAQKLGVQLPPLQATPACGAATLAKLSLRKGGAKPSKPLKLGMVALASAKPKRDADRLVVRCVPNAGAGTCPANANGGPRELALTVAQTGTDLDNGWTGVSHNFPVAYGAVLRLCINGCDATANPSCTGDDAATDTVNGATFGSPVPLFAASIPVCIVSRYASPKITAVTADVQSGRATATAHLLTDVYLTSGNQLCPRCSGKDLGQAGTCDTGQRAGQACRTDGIVTIGSTMYTLSSDCQPLGPPAGTLTVTLPLTTGTSTLSGPKPCGASQDDFCGGSACSATCTGSACVRTNGQGQCIDAKGGVSQLCCAGQTDRPCFPTAGGGQIQRIGAAGAPLPRWPDPTYPKNGDIGLVATFCEPATGTATLDAVTGLPGPGALILPGTATWIK